MFQITFDINFFCCCYKYVTIYLKKGDDVH